MTDTALLGLKAPKLDTKVIEPLTDVQLRALLKACAGPDTRDRRDEALVRFMVETGARAGETVALALADVDLMAGVAIVRRGKGGKGRAVPFGAQTARAIDRYRRLRAAHRLAATPALWLGDRGKEFSYDALHKSLKERAVRAGIVGFHPHLLRHTAAHRWLAAGGSEGGLMAVAGWSQPDMLTHGRRVRVLHDVPGAVPVRLRWRQRTWRCPDAGRPEGVFVEQHLTLVAPRASLTSRAVTWAIEQLRREHATIQGLSRQLGVAWKTLWRAVQPRLAELAADPARLDGVATLGVDEHVWHHTPHKAAAKGPTMLTGMVDLTRDCHGRVHARLLDLVPGRSGTVLADWLKDRSATFRDSVQVATLDPFRGYANALRDELGEATPVLDAFYADVLVMPMWCAFALLRGVRGAVRSA